MNGPIASEKVSWLLARQRHKLKCLVPFSSISLLSLLPYPTVLVLSFSSRKGRGTLEGCQLDVAKEALEQEDDYVDDDDDDDGGIDWEYLSSKTEGCQARDLAKLVKRCVYSLFCVGVFSRPLL